MAEGVVKLKQVAQDGTRVRASAGAASFRRGATLAQCLEQAREQVERLKAQIDADPVASKPPASARSACRGPLSARPRSPTSRPSKARSASAHASPPPTPRPPS